MNIGIVFYSKTGNTLSVAKKIKERLEKAGHSVNMEQIGIAEDKNKADIGQYDLVIFGSPVRAFSASPVIKEYLNQLNEGNKQAYCFVTHFLPFKWMGGKSALEQMKQFCKKKNIEVSKSGIISWSRNRETAIGKLADEFAKEA
jgi:NAD(P)H dehydrogenase (quinone)